MNRGWRGRVPWWLRIALKIVLSRLPLPYGFWKRFRLFEHGAMDQPATATSTLLEHARTAGVIDEANQPPCFVNRPGFAMLEVGPGDSLASGIAAHALGASRSVLIDAGDFAKRDLRSITALVTYLRAQGYAVPDVQPGESVQALLAARHVNYLTRGVDSLATLEAASIDFCFSNAVMEHIPKAEFERFARELKRVLKPGGVCVHRVDFLDHLGGGLNNLRFSERTWEGELFSRSGFYTNRIRPREMCEMFEAAGFDCEVTREARWPALPLARSALDEQFRDLPEAELLVYGLDVRLHHVRAKAAGA